MIRAVVDTNVIVSGLLKPFSDAATILRQIIAGEVTLCIDARIISEYRDVLYRPKFAFNHTHVEAFLEFIATNSKLVNSTPLRFRLPDPDDEPFLEVAISGRAEFLVTGNSKHFPKARRGKIKVVSPGEFVRGHHN